MAISYFEPLSAASDLGGAPVDVLVPAGQAKGDSLVQLGNRRIRGGSIHRSDERERPIPAFAVNKRCRFGGIEPASFGFGPPPIRQVVQGMLAIGARHLSEPVGGGDPDVRVFA
jgi:hypothetical protein